MIDLGSKVKGMVTNTDSGS